MRFSTNNISMKLNGGPLKQGRFKGYALMKKVARGALPTDACWNGSHCSDPLKAHQTTIFSWKGFRMNPSNLSKLVC